MPTTPAQAPYPHFGDVGVCDLIACSRDAYDGHEYWDNATTYARDHHPDGTVCTHMGPCDSPACHKRPAIARKCIDSDSQVMFPGKPGDTHTCGNCGREYRSYTQPGDSNEIRFVTPHAMPSVLPYVLAAHTGHGVEISDGRKIFATVANVLDAQIWAHQNDVAIRFA